MTDSLPLELAAMTVSLPSDITNGTLEEFEEVLHTSSGGGERKDMAVGGPGLGYT